ncbi:MAG: hypothetical protein HYX61_09600 [Gammaproteobacteria bacterium]|jgi:hypothetical protein|nr:hypothetical protein [Gammaproteobacteria bacterium]
MSYILETVEFEPEIKKWLEWFCHENERPFSQALNLILDMGRQVAENEKKPFELPKAQKLVIQCVMESLLILKEAYLPEPQQRQAISENAKVAIRKTLGYPETECHSS